MMEPQQHNTKVWHAWLYCYVYNTTTKHLPTDVFEYWAKISLILIFSPLLFAVFLPWLILNIVGSIKEGYIKSDNGTWKEYLEDVRIGLECDSFGDGDRWDAWFPILLVTYVLAALVILVIVFAHWSIPLIPLSIAVIYCKFARYKYTVPKSNNPKITWHDDDEYSI